MTEPGADPAPESVAAARAATCPWCAAPAAPGTTRCTACGAAIAQLDSIGDLRIPGLTSVDPALLEFDKRPLHIPGPSPTQGVAPALIIGAVAGGPIGIAAIGGVAALAAAEFTGAKIGEPGGMALEDLGKPSELMLQALEHAEDAKAGGASGASSTSGASSPGPAPDAPPVADAAGADDGMSIWRDLPSSDLPPAEPPPEADGT